MTAAEAHEIHPPHQAAWDVSRQLNYNRRGEPMPLDDCVVTGFGLYTKRRFVRPLSRAVGMASWLLPAEVLDQDEFVAAVSAGYLDGWLRTDHGIELSWP